MAKKKHKMARLAHVTCYDTNEARGASTQASRISQRARWQVQLPTAMSNAHTTGSFMVLLRLRLASVSFMREYWMVVHPGILATATKDRPSMTGWPNTCKCEKRKVCKSLVVRSATKTVCKRKKQLTNGTGNRYDQAIHPRFIPLRCGMHRDSTYRTYMNT